MPRLLVSGPYEFTDLRVLDPGLRVVATGTGFVDRELPPGIYRVLARGPGAFDERLVAVKAEGDTRVTDFALPLDSPAPVTGARTYHEDHERPAQSESLSVHVAFSEQHGSQLFAFVRSDGSPRTTSPLLSVETREREVIARLDRDGRNEPKMGFGALTVALPAGTYALVHEAPGLGHRAQAVFVEDGWQTQVFIPWDADGIDPSRALVSMLRLGRGFDPNAPWEYEHVEAALDGLARGRVVLTPSEEQAFLDAKFSNPVLGLIGTYAYLLRGDVDPRRLMVITYNLLSLLPHSPDAHLLYRLAQQTGGEAVTGFEPPVPVWTGFDIPPMFAAGTDRLLDRAAEDASLVPAASLMAAVAATRTSGSVWTRWNTDLDASRQTRELLQDVMEDRRGSAVERAARQAGLPRSAVEKLLGSQPAGLGKLETKVKPLKKLINAVDDFVPESLEGLALAHGDLVAVNLDPAVVYRVDAPRSGKVDLAKRVIDNVRSMGLALSSCTVPAAGTPTFDLGDDEVEIGIGIHGEPGRVRIKMESADQLTDRITRPVIEDLGLSSGEQVIAFVNSMGGTPLAELYVVYRRLAQLLDQGGVQIARSLIGPFITSLEMQGASVTILRLDDELTRLWDAPVRTPGLRWGV